MFSEFIRSAVERKNEVTTIRRGVAELANWYILGGMLRSVTVILSTPSIIRLYKTYLQELGDESGTLMFAPGAIKQANS